MTKVLEVRGINKSFKKGTSSISVLKDLDLNVSQQSSVSIMGQSGTGKSTLLQIIGTILRPSSGSVQFESKNVFEMNDRKVAKFRNQNIGFVFQFHHLLPDFSAVENVMMPMHVAREDIALARERAELLLKLMGLGERLDHKPFALSGGEQQRVAIARALINQPKLIIADEPTGNLDTKTAEHVSGVLFDLVKEKEVALIVATHHKDVADHADEHFVLAEGKLS